MKKFMVTAAFAAAVVTQGYAHCKGTKPGCITVAQCPTTTCTAEKAADAPEKCAKKGVCKATDSKMCDYMPKVCKKTSDSLKTFGDKLSYAFGMSMAKQLDRMPADINPNIDGEINSELVIAGLLHSVSKSKSLLTDEETQKIMTEFQQKMQAAQMKRMQEAQSKQAEAGKGALEAGKKFLEENKKKEGVVTTASGLQYKVLTAAEGKKPSATDTVEVHYHGTTIDGNVFDSSVQRGEKISFPLNGVIKGWTEGVQLMSVGSKFRFFIPSELAYGERGAGGAIPPNATLIFDVELFSIK